MDGSQIRIIEWYAYNETVLSPFGLGFVILMGLLFLSLPRRYALLPLIAIACFITHRQRIVIGGIDFSMLRIMVIFGSIRVLKDYDYRLIYINTIDKAVIGWVIVSVITGIFLWQTVSVFINRIGFAYDVLGLYFLSRIYNRSIEDMAITIKFMLFLSIIVSIFMIIEQVLERNFFSFLGGVPEFTVERDGRLRSQGAFSHAVLAGTFGALLLPQVIGQWYEKKNSLLTVIGIVAATIITVTSASSGPLMSYAAGIVGLFFWKFRKKTRLIFWGTVVGLICLHIVMKAPVWHLIGRLSFVGGSTGYHRVRLINASVYHFNEWWLLGIKSTAHWGWGLQDTTNMFILQGNQGGIVRLILFVLIIMLCFKAIGRVVSKLEKQHSQKFVWSIGTSLFVHVVSFLGVAYFGQFVFFLYMSFAMISTISTIDFHKSALKKWFFVTQLKNDIYCRQH